MKKHGPITDARIRSAKPGAKAYRLHVGDGLALLVTPAGSKSWQLRYRLDGKEQTATLGKLAVLSLAEARTEATEKMALVLRGEHLTTVKRMAKVQKQVDATNTFGAVASAWIESEARDQEWSANYKAELAASLKKHLSALYAVPVGKIRYALVGPLLDRMKKKGNAPTQAGPTRARLRAILDAAVENELIPINPIPAARRRKKRVSHYAAVVDLPGIGEILRDAAARAPVRGVMRAHALMVFAAQRLTEVRKAEWSEFELGGVDVLIDNHRTRHDPRAGNWSIPRSRMKMSDDARGPHVIPLPPHLLFLLRSWKKADGPDAVYVCPGRGSKPIRSETVELFYRRVLNLAGRHSPHSWRSAFKTVCSEAGKDSDAVESQLDHLVGNAVAASYDRAQRVELRRELMTWYEATLIAARDGATVTALPIKRPS